MTDHSINRRALALKMLDGLICDETILNKIMHINELEEILIKSLNDFKLDQDEKYQFRELSESLADDQLRFLRNRAFELSRRYIQAGGENAVRVHNWLDRLVKIIQPLNKKTHLQPEAYFSPGNDCRNKIINLIEAARTSINICVFTISDNKITQAILEAHKRGVVITIISDNDKSNDRGSDIDLLSKKGVKVILDQSSYHMHHKFAVFDNSVLLNGSFNWTRSASDVNEENITVIADSTLVVQFSDKFNDLKTKFDN